MKYLMPAAVLMLMVSIDMSLDLHALVAYRRRLSASAWVRLLLATSRCRRRSRCCWRSSWGCLRGSSPGSRMAHNRRPWTPSVTTSTSW